MNQILLKKDLFHAPETPDDKPYLFGGRCSVCGYTCFPEKKVCLRCLRDDSMAPLKLGRHGRLETFAVMRVGTPDFQAPYVIGYVKTDEGALVFTQITECEPEDDALKIGEEMELVIEEIRKDGQGNELIGWKYRPVRGISS